jgi:hypothetical protein
MGIGGEVGRERVGRMAPEKAALLPRSLIFTGSMVMTVV